MRRLPCYTFLTFICVACSIGFPAHAAELLRITPENYGQVVPVGKEVDAILGDWVLRNDKVVAVIANPHSGRNANMTVRGVGGMLIDFTQRGAASDQLGCFYPSGGRYSFEDNTVEVQVGEELSSVDVANLNLANGKKLVQPIISMTVTGQPIAKDGTLCRVTYTLRDGEDWLDYSVEIVNNSAEPRNLLIEDLLRCDGNLFKTATNDELRLFTAEDVYFGQCYGFLPATGTIRREGGRNMQLRSSENTDNPVAAGESLKWAGQVYCSQGLPGVLSWAKARLTNAKTYPLMLKLQSPQGPLQHASVELLRSGESMGTIMTDSKGMVQTDLIDGSYVAKISAVGHEDRMHEITIEGNRRSDTLSFTPASRVRAKITDGDGVPIAAKVQFVGIDGTPNPDFGPDSAIAAIKNVVYCAKGQFEQPIDPGKYQVIISHGPEYDAEFREIEVTAGALTQLTCTLPRTVDTQGWISSDFHSHSSPSGDNVSHQTGRVLNLLAEHVEFAPCTEHNRIDTYEDDLLLLDATSAMATCTGMELTGSPLPVDHQNAFPLHRHEHTQDGGGPVTDIDPVKQIERLALWDNSSVKVVQSNHPNIPQILGDRDLDGKPDDGFRGMLGWMDVIEIHPPEGIFTPPPSDIQPKDMRSNPTFFWMQLLNLGYRIPGVVNTDAHYNFHGSGWLRNYMVCSSDNPSEISMDEIIHSAEHGHMVMTTGPFLEFEVRTNDGQSYTCGDDVALKDELCRLWIRVQCPNWFDVNRVQVFANGRPIDDMNFTRKSHPRLFRDTVVRFEVELEMPKPEQDMHLIVATIGEGLKLGPVMGVERGELPPVAVTNPVFIDVDGSGFQPNGDDLGVPFMLPDLKTGE